MTTPPRAGRLRSGREELLDTGLLLLLVSLALIGLRTSFSGWSFFAVGLIGAVLGLLIARLLITFGMPLVLLAPALVAAFFLFGGIIALFGVPDSDVLPTGRTLRLLAVQSVHGWKDLLTTLPPVDGRGPSLVLPYLLGLFAGAVGFGVARRSRLSLAPAGVCFVVLVLAILLGTEASAARLLQGAVFGAVALGWGALRSHRLHPPLRSGSGRLFRISTTVGLLMLALIGSSILGPGLPGADAHQRLVLRSYVHPPLDIGQYPSPLASYRKYTSWRKDSLYNRPLFTVSGLPVQTPIQLATLDAYTGTVWAAANRPQSTNLVSDTFQKVGATIANAAAGTRRTMTVTVDDGYTDYWLPAAGAVSGVRFTGARASELATNLRYNLATGSGLVPDQLRPGDHYTLQVTLSRDTGLKATDQLLMISDPSDGAAGFLSSYSQQWSSKSTGSQAAAVIATGDYLKNTGRYSNGEAGYEYYLPGHSQYRLKQFAAGLPPVALVGDDEQYAAAYALLIEDLGTPARVVLGALSTSDGLIRGQDIHAWVEVQLVDRSWRMISTDNFMKRLTPTKLEKPKQPPQGGQIVPPPTGGRPHSALDDANQDNSSSSATPPKKRPTGVLGSIQLPGWLVATAKYVGGPLTVLLLLCAMSTAAKAFRRQLRRHRGTPLRQLSTGWQELVDHARDLGVQVPQRRATRREQGRGLEVLGIGALANLADSYVFGPGCPTEQDAEHYWTRVLSARKQMSSTVGRWRRLRAAVSLVSWHTNRLGVGRS
jgi:hypothetical protein